MTDHQALVISLASVGDYEAAADAHTAHLKECKYLADLNWAAAFGPARTTAMQAAHTAQEQVRLWLVAIDKNLRGEVEALVSRWQREAVA